MSRRYLRPGAIVGHVLVLAAALTCLRLGWWQWNVSESARGTAQNLGYALLWPVFAGSFIYMWLRYLHLEADAEGDAPEEDEEPHAATAASEDAADASADAADASENEARAANQAAARAAMETAAFRAATRADLVRLVGAGVIGDDEDDPELAAYNAALAQLADEDERRAR